MVIYMEVELWRMTWKEVEEYLKNKKEIILPICAVEEHGYHLPLSTDCDITIAIVKELSKRTKIAYLPPIYYGVCVSTSKYTGTISVRFETLMNYLIDILKSIKESGFEKIYIVSGHLGSMHKAAIKEACRRADIECYFLDMTKIDIGDILESEPMHACEAETSLMLYLYENFVRKEKIVDENYEIPKYLVGETLTKSGVFGKPSKASKEKGEKIFKRIIEEFEKVLKGEIK